MELRECMGLHNEKQHIAQGRARIVERMRGSGSAFSAGRAEALAVRDVQDMFFLYDEVFFEGMLGKRLEGGLAYRLSNRMTRTGGKVQYDRREGTYVLALSYPLVVYPFDGKASGVDVNGIPCSSSMEVMMGIMEHEIIHIIEFELHGRSSCGKRPFKTMARNIFGHTGTKHSLSTTHSHGTRTLRPGSRGASSTGERPTPAPLRG
ncbi:MAG TPA: hypothetical protein ENN11_01980 [Methanomicrobia archaeon]|nr:hypothetical protein [Methanomicrobia archaeon]